MDEFDQKEFNKFIVNNNVVGFFPEGRTLKSGRFSYWYANCRNLQDNVGIMDKTVSFLLSFVKEKGFDFDYVYGVPEGVTKLADIANYKLGMENNNPSQPLVIGRGKPKEHGDPKDKYFIGPAKSGDKIIVVEDVTTTGGSMLKSLDSLKEAGIGVVAVIALVNRGEIREDGKTVAQCVEEKGSKYFSMSKANDLIPLAIEKNDLSSEFLQKFQEKYNEFAIEKINVLKE